MLKTKVAVLVSGGGTNLQKLIEAQQQGRMAHGEIVLVLSSDPAAYALTRARAADIPAQAVDWRTCPDKAAFEEQLQQRLQAAGAEVIVLAGFLRILSPAFIQRWPQRIINVHPSLIPAFCGSGFYGLRVHEAALARGVKLTGATVHLVNEIPDGGRILKQQAVEVLADDTPESLQRRVMEQAEWILLPQATEELCQSVYESKQGEQA